MKTHLEFDIYFLLLIEDGEFYQLDWMYFPLKQKNLIFKTNQPIKQKR